MEPRIVRVRTVLAGNGRSVKGILILVIGIVGVEIGIGAVRIARIAGI